MPIRTVPSSEVKYYLLSFDSNGVERDGDSDGSGERGLLSERIYETIAGEPVTDIFMLSHGWKGDIPAAIEQYDRWIGTMVAQQADIDRMRQKRPGFNPLIIGIHWPSQPWGDEEFGDGSFGPGEGLTVEKLIDRYAARIADTPTARAALDTIFKSAENDMNPAKMSPEVYQAYVTLNEEADLSTKGEGDTPGDDREKFNPEFAYEAAKQDPEASFGGFSLGGILSPLRQLSFWKMKKRAREVGESGVSDFLREVQERTAPPKDVRIHLMGHSFGCIVVSGMLKGSDGHPGPIRPVSSVSLIQGALSLWSFCDDIPKAPGKPGYFYPIISGRKVEGPIITTRSVFDRAVGYYYPIGAGIARQIDYATTLPKYGALGTFGIQGPGPEIIDQEMLDTNSDYGFEAGKVYNLESSNYINTIEGASGAHNDIAKPEVAHVVWEAALPQA